MTREKISKFLQFKVRLEHFLSEGLLSEAKRELAHNLSFCVKSERKEIVQLLQNRTLLNFNKNFTWVKNHVILLRDTQETNLLKEFISSVQTYFSSKEVSRLKLELGLSMQQDERYSEAATLFHSLFPTLKGEALGIAYANFGYSSFETKMPWEDAFLTSFTLLHGLELARAKITFGYCLSQSERISEAQAAWIEAVPLTKHRVTTKSFVLYNLAASFQKELAPAAESYWLELEKITRNAKIADLHACALNGIAVQRRIFGEWSRAEIAYLAAKKSALGVDLLTSIWGLTRVYILSNSPSKALPLLKEALQNPDLAKNQLYAAKASVLLALNDLNGTRENLELAGDITLESVRWLLAFTKAELARREGREADALRYLENLPVTHLHPKEEAGRHPELCVLLEKNGLPVPMPLLYSQGIVVRVEATNFLMVCVNNRIINVPPTGKIAELLVYLLENQGIANASDLEMNLFFKANAANNLLNGAASKLRSLLGWAESVRYDLKTKKYSLDPSITWQYDITEARVRKLFIGEFLKGMKDPPEWVLTIREELAKLKP